MNNHHFHLNEESAKRAAAGIQARMKEVGVELRLGQAYEALAAAAGHRNWATMKAALARADGSGPSGDEAPAEGTREAAIAAAAVHGFVPAVMIDVKAETERLRKIDEREGIKPLSEETIRRLALEYCDGRGGGDQMYSDFFADWMHDEGVFSNRPKL